MHVETCLQYEVAKQIRLQDWWQTFGMELLAWDMQWVCRHQLQKSSEALAVLCGCQRCWVLRKYRNLPAKFPSFISFIFL